ncbi:MAG: transcriptional regulator GcvA [Pseudomonadota bacterium]
MTRQLPPLTAMRAFEAAARHESFKLAALELHVTPAAVSLQVRQLEEWLGLPLFDRSGNALALTAKGQRYRAQLSKALNLLALATEEVSGNGLSGPLRITALPSFARKWLLPRLGKFRQRYPDIDVILDTDAVSQNLSGRKFDLAIRAGTGRWQGLQSDLIARESFTPMCSPALRDGAIGLASPDDLRLHDLIHSTPRDGWERWLALAGVQGVDATRGMTLNDSSLVLEAALLGQGVALGRTFLAADDIADGKLVAPFALALPNDYSYWLVYPSASAGLAHVEAFRGWLLAEAAS